MTIAIITGGRNYDDRVRVIQILDASIERLGVDAVVTADAHACGDHADAWAAEHDFPRIRVKGFQDMPEYHRLMIDIAAGWDKRVMFAFSGFDPNAVAQARGDGVTVYEIKP